MEQNNKTKPILLTSLVILLAITVLVLAFKDHGPEYRVSAEEMHEMLKEYDKNVISPIEFVEIYYNNDSLYRFIDLRNPRDYANGHLPNSINVPLEELLSEKNIEILNQGEKINVFYHDNHAVACSPWMVLTQVGYKNNKILQGGYDYVKNHIIDNYSPLSGEFRDEKAKYNYRQMILDASAGGSPATDVQNDAPAVVPIKKKETAEDDEGGC